jgi:hypothetical protein
MTRLELIKFFLIAPLIWTAQPCVFAQSDTLHKSPESAERIAPTLRASAPNGRRFYLTRTKVTGTTAVNACKSGFHMASLGELFNVRFLQYDAVLGLKGDEYGSAPTSDSTGRAFGWIQNDFSAPSANVHSEVTNCCAEKASSDGQVGTAAYLVRTIQVGSSTVNAFSTPWRYMFTRVNAACNVPQRVWCIQD